MDPGILRKGFKYHLDNQDWVVLNVSVSGIVTSKCVGDEKITSTMSVETLQRKFSDREAMAVDQS